MALSPPSTGSECLKNKKHPYLHLYFTLHVAFSCQQEAPTFALPFLVSKGEVTVICTPPVPPIETRWLL